MRDFKRFLAFYRRLYRKRSFQTLPSRQTLLFQHYVILKRFNLRNFYGNVDGVKKGRSRLKTRTRQENKGKPYGREEEKKETRSDVKGSSSLA